MNSALLSKVQVHLDGYGCSVQNAASFAPGLVGVHVAIPGHQSKHDVYMDMSRWVSQDTLLWPLSYLACSSPNMRGIGRLSGLGRGCPPSSMPSLFEYAQDNLKPARTGIGWYAEPREITPSEIGALALVSEETAITSVAELDPTQWSIVKHENVASAVLMTPAEREMHVPENPLQGLQGGVGSAEGVMQRFWKVAEEIVRDGAYFDHVRPGTMRPEIPVREIELLIGSGLIRHTIKVKASINDVGLGGLHAHLYRLTYARESDDNMDSIDGVAIGTLMGAGYFGYIPYHEVGLNMSRRVFENASTLDAFRVIVPFIPGFHKLAAKFLQSAS